MRSFSMPEDLKTLARSGRLRAAINTGNRALVHIEGGRLGGISPELARRLATEIGATLETVVYDGAGKVFDDVGRDIWDVAFLAIDPTRAQKITFTRPYVVIEATYAVRSESSIVTVEDADREGHTVVLSRGSAYDMHLTATLQHAAVERAATPAESFTDFRKGRGDAVAGVRETLESAFGGDPDFRILPDAFKKVEQAMALPGFGNPRVAALDAFVERAIGDGFVERHFSSSER
ncbi:transporter substrate-binding domain-containing protein [Pelagibacterium halotolerans]|uniref:transporter substrate-binding domain-containing protein n=1 Tax=Pelagibacterium halotolerans TaxID=531813 RepID=UPI00384DA65A